MYKTILVTLEVSPSDRAIIDHIKPLAKEMRSRITLLHVATGWAARLYGPEAVSSEISDDQAYLDKVREEFEAEGVEARTEIAYGDPAEEIIRRVERNGFDLVAMSTHGHKLLGDVFLGSTAFKVQHNVSVPVLLLRAV